MASHNDKHRVYRTSQKDLVLTLNRVQPQLTPEALSVVHAYLKLLPQLLSTVEGRPLPAQRAKTLAESARAAKIAANKGSPERALGYTRRAFAVLVDVHPASDDIADVLAKLPDLTTVRLAALPGKPGHIPGRKPRPPRKPLPRSAFDKLVEK